MSILQKGKQKVELGYYSFPEKVGFVGWIKDRTTGEVIHIDLEGRLCTKTGKRIAVFSTRKRFQKSCPFNPSFRINN